MEVAQKIKAVREAKGITQTYVANNSEMTVQNYNMKENGKRTITTSEVEVIARALQVPASIFFEEKFNEKLNKLKPKKKEVG